MKQLEEDTTIKLSFLLITILFLMGCENKIIERPDSIIMNDVVGNRMEIYGQSKDEMIAILKKQNLYEDKDMWFYIDREFYKVHQYDALTSGIEDVSDSLVVIWFSKDPNSKEELITEHHRSDNIVKHTKRWFLTVGFDEGRNRTLDVEYQF